jgi:hypothetical protein
MLIGIYVPVFGVSVPSRYETCWYHLRHDATLKSRRRRPYSYMLVMRYLAIRVRNAGRLLSQVRQT